MDPSGTFTADGHLRGLSGWQKHPGFTIPQLQAVPNILAVGVGTGLSLSAWDWDGETSVDYSCEFGLAPWALDSWHVHRSTDPWRLKVLTLLTPEQLAQLPQQSDGGIEFQSSITTKAPDPTVEGDKGQALEFFYSKGRQVNVIGNHKESGGFYYWPEGLGPENLKVMPDNWFRFVLAAAKTQQRIDSTVSTASPKARHSKTGMKRLDPCPICGRNSHKGNGTWCDQTADGLIFCMKGSTFNAERSHGRLTVGKSKVNGYRLTKETKECFVFAPLAGGRNV